ncbi:MAG: S9 family peptidase [Anaerolineae bacterium]|nr:S9 family peptidase [Anaerolineae bacterium]
MKPLNLTPDAPWRARFHAATINFAVMAQANPARGLVSTNRDGIHQLYAWEVATGELRQLTHVATGKPRGYISADGQWIYYHNDEAGNEIGHYVRVPFEGGQPQDITPEMQPYSSFLLSQSASGRVSGFMAAGDGGFGIYTQSDGAAPRLLAHFNQLCYGPCLSQDGQIAVVETADRTGTLDRSLVAYDVASGHLIAELWDGEGFTHSFGPFSPIPGDMRLLATTTRTGFDRPLIWNPRTGERIDLPLDGIPGDVTAWGWSPDAERILLCQIHQSQFQLYLYTVATGQVTRLNHPAGVIGNGFSDSYGGYFTPQGELYVTWSDSVHPARLVALDGVTGDLKRTVLSAREVPAGRKWRSVSFPSTDGVTIQGWLGTPEGDGPFPTILETHGGPTAVMNEYFTPSAQAWIDHGFAYLTINYRGSTTFGKDFEKAIWGRLGSVEVEDMAAARDWLVSEGIAQADSILITGWSYGGYLTLQGLGKRPDLWAGGMAGIAIADWTTMYEDQADTLRGYQRALFGGTPQEKPEAHRDSSPITYAGAVRAPVLVIQGSNDTRCPPRQMRLYEDVMRQHGKDIQIHWFEAGHGSNAVDQQIEHMEILLRFAYRVLG